MRTFTHADIEREARVVFVNNAVNNLLVRLRRVGCSLVVHIELPARKGETLTSKRSRVHEAVRFAKRTLHPDLRVVHTIHSP